MVGNFLTHIIEVAREKDEEKKREKEERERRGILSDCLYKARVKKRRIGNLQRRSRLSPLMATRKNYLGKPNYRFLNTGDNRDTNLNSETTMFEFDEASLWNSNNHHQHHVTSPDQFKKSIPSSRISKKVSSKRGAENGDRADGTAKSLPVNIPDWSKILREDRKDNRRIVNNDYMDDDDDEDEEDENGRIPPHEFLARQLGRTKIASFSVHEGIGRTLKGRDLSRVRDAIWEKTGFED